MRGRILQLGAFVALALAPIAGKAQIDPVARGLAATGANLVSKGAPATPDTRFDPAAYLPHSIAAGSNAKYCIAGDSTGTAGGADSVTGPPGVTASPTSVASVDLLWDQLRTRIIEDNASIGVTLTTTGNFFNYSIGGQTLSQLRDGSSGSTSPISTSYPSWWTNTSSGKWLSYGVANGCTAWFINMGVNGPGNETGAIWNAVLTQLSTTTYHPDIVIITPISASPFAGAPYSQDNSQVGYIGNAQQDRTIAWSGDNLGISTLPKIGLIDVGRLFDQAVLGFDPVSESYTYVIPWTAPVSGITTFPYILPGATGDGTSASTTAASGTGSTATVTFSGSKVYPVGSFIKIYGMAPKGYNGVYVVTSSSAGSVSYQNTTTGSQTIAGTIASTTQATDGDFYLSFTITGLGSASGPIVSLSMGDVGGASGVFSGNQLNIQTTNGSLCYMNYYSSAGGNLNSTASAWNGTSNTFVVIAKGSRIQSFCNGTLIQDIDKARMAGPFTPQINITNPTGSESMTINAFAASVRTYVNPSIKAADCYGVLTATNSNGNGINHVASACLNRVYRSVLEKTKFAAAGAALLGVYNQLPIYASGFSTGTPAIAGSSGTYAFTVTLGATPGSSGVLTMPLARSGWACVANDNTTTAGTVRQTASTASSVTFSLAGTVANDVISFQCSAY